MNTQMTTTVYAFKWTTFAGTTIESNECPADNGDIMELILTKSKSVRACDSIPEHERIMSQLPPRLEVLRMDKCRIRTWPHLPLSIREVYAEGNDFFHVPSDLSIYTQLIVLELSNGRLEDLITRLPPNIARADVSLNALQTIRIEGNWPQTLTFLYAYNNPSRMKIESYVNNICITRANPFQGFRVINYADPELPFQTRRTQLSQHNVYKNTQNVHDSGVQSATRKNLEYIASFSQKRTRDQLLFSLSGTNTYLGFFGCIAKIFNKKETKKGVLQSNAVRELEVRLSHPYSMHGHHINDIVDGLWAKICSMTGEAQQTAIQRFEEEIADGKNHCTNGFVVRLSNVLLGLDDNVQMQLNASQILQARIPQTMASKRKAGSWKEGEEPWEWSRDCFIETAKDLDECDVYTILERQKWLLPFLEGFEDELLKDCHTREDVAARWKNWKLPDEPWALAQCERNIEK